jgi:bifunctional ADP-heptose synthase (sugar kinase/adenylyltransferase)
MGKKILIIGDTIVDRDINLRVVGLSLESPTLKTCITGESVSFGGAANVAKFAHLFGAEVSFITCMSEDSAKLFLSKYDIKLININKDVENIKTRFYVKHGDATYKHLQVNSIDTQLESLPNNKHPIECLNPICFSRYDLIAISDYRCGLVTDGLIDKIADSECLTFGASQVSDKQSNLHKYSKLNYIVCNKNESKTIDRKDNMVITDGKNGCELNGIHYPAFGVSDGKKTIGAGDCFYAAFLAYDDIEQANKTAFEYMEGKYSD